MKKIVFLFVLIAAILAVSSYSYLKSPSESSAGDEVSVMLYKSQSCGCCGLYEAYLKRNGYRVQTINEENMFSVKDKYGIPQNLESCHTAVYGNYFVEGHVPIEAVEKLLNEKPNIKGIALPGMPSASPGMPGPKIEDFNIYSVSENGETSLFMTI